MVFNMRALLVLGVLAFAAVVMVHAAAAQAGNSGATKPGNGFGDQNHVHTGPPGQSVRP